jgi:putative membrane protein
MAWTRTATSLISFGFTIYTFFHNFGNREQANRPAGARNAALAMISVGLVCLLLATIRHQKDVHELEAEYAVKPRRTAPIVAGLIVVLGIFGLITVAFRL